MGIFNDDLDSAFGRGIAHGIGHFGGAIIGSAIAGAIDGAVQNKHTVQVTKQTNQNNNNETKNLNNDIILHEGNKVIKCPGCGHRCSILYGNGKADYCEYCGTIIGN